jgi:predicted component of type VI protein secretion system
MDREASAIRIYEREVQKAIASYEVRLAALQSYSDTVSAAKAMVNDLPQKLTHPILGKCKH